MVLLPSKISLFEPLTAARILACMEVFGPALQRFVCVERRGGEGERGAGRGFWLLLRWDIDDTG